ncbi:hypothetical protein BW723_07700 [Polaribacter reichenbachii]|uniref:WG repeat-containing protein n=1 Tax=Polaribacter reichenbachii TaxID=996801 RepID=A0A1B8U6D1_9FLAO|nr:hypothetical protein [Polaribacter reichenbachii]APZ46188.1 hypothetical protein BW723_07700 [Polaribacter reichenbachii]AUC20050.1 hypothetical protein BTO17_15720 [Polaribacter reichenbachii]OBY67402.1 hypothetical protein LPB301_01790 [Polaribacter reichenbachii]
MKKIVIVVCLLAFGVTEAQTNKDIANVYIRKANEVLTESIDFETALTMFQKAMKYTDTISDKKIASLGASVYFETYHKQPTLKEQLAFLEKAKYYSKQYFDLNNGKNKNSEDFINNSDNYVFILENIDSINAKLEKIEADRIKKEKELRRIDSLKTVWVNKSNELSFKADSIYKFNKNNVALYTNDGYFGLLNDKGEVLLKANEYEDAISFDGFVIFKNKAINPTKLFSYNTNNHVSFQLPSISDFNTLSTHYGKVMLPRGNGRLVTYPNNTHSAFVYDLNVKKMIKVANLENLLKRLEKFEAIRKYNKDEQVKIDKEWYNFGGHLGGGIHPLYGIEDYNLKGFLCSIDGKFINASSGYQYIGGFHNNKYQAYKGTEVLWVNQNGTKVSTAKDEGGKYTGNSVVSKLENGKYQITKDGIIVLGKESLEKMVDFLRSFTE